MNKKEMLYAPKLPEGFETEEFNVEEWIKLEEENRNQIIRIEEIAKKENSLLYRFLYEPIADGKGIYQIIKVNNKTCRVRYCSTDGYHGYMVRQWGEEATVGMEYVLQCISRQDAFRC